MIHLTMNQISAYIDGELPQASVELVRLHLSSCLECAERFGYLEEQEEALARLLVNDPGDAFFAGFAERVLGPEVPPAEPKAAPRETPASAPARASAPSSERVEAAAPARAAAAPPPARAAATPLAPAKAAAEFRGAARERHPGKGRLLILASALILIVSSIGIVALRRGTLDSPTVSWIVEHLDPTSWFGGSSSSRRGGPDVVDRRPEPAPADSSPAIPTVVDSGALDRAAARSAMAESVRSPEAYDEAAAAWTDALPLLENDPEELASGRREVASSRYVAWSLMPTPNRRAAALDAVRAYLLVAPPGPERDLAWKWLARLKR